MSNQDRIVSEIEQNKKLLKELDEKMDLILKKIKDENTPEDDKISLKEELELLNYEYIDVSADIAMLQEMLDKEVYHDEDEDKEKYDSWDEVFTGGDY